MGNILCDVDRFVFYFLRWVGFGLEFVCCACAGTYCMDWGDDVSPWRPSWGTFGASLCAASMELFGHLFWHAVVELVCPLLMRDAIFKKKKVRFSMYHAVHFGGAVCVIVVDQHFRTGVFVLFGKTHNCVCLF